MGEAGLGIIEELDHVSQGFSIEPKKECEYEGSSTTVCTGSRKAESDFRSVSGSAVKPA